jgi:AcrR family transcriptional regulator
MMKLMSSNSFSSGDGTEQRRGPRGQRGEIQDRIIDAARDSFATNGYAGTSMRAVARAAEVDAALVNYYFASKSALLDAALDPPEVYAARIAQAAQTPMPQRARALVRAMIDSWEDPETSPFLRSIILTAAHEPVAMKRMRETVAVLIIGAMSDRLSDNERELRAALIASQIIGVAMTRYIWRSGPLATIPAGDVVALVAPTINNYLTQPLPRHKQSK